MDDMVHFVVIVGLAVCIVLAFFLAIYRAKSFFRGFERLRTEAFLARMSKKSVIVRFLRRRWATPSGRAIRAGMVSEFMKAAELGNLSEVRRLLGAGTDVNVRRAKGGKTALMKASQNGCVHVVAFLLQAGADVDATGGLSGKTALIRSSENGHWEVIELLIKAGANVNAKGPASGQTALMKAIEHGNLAAALLLIKAGADLRVRDKKGRTAEDIGVQCARLDLLENLRKRGAGFTSRALQVDVRTHVPDDDECYALLGCTKTDSLEEIRMKYHALIKQLHPDAIRAKGTPDAFSKYAYERLLQTQEAYQRIMKMRN